RRDAGAGRGARERGLRLGDREGRRQARARQGARSGAGRLRGGRARRGLGRGRGPSLPAAPRVLVVLCHPDEGSPGPAWAADALAERYAADLLGADAVVVVHPVWFFGPPAALKGWVERVVREGVAFDVGEGGAVTGRLTAGAALVVTTGNAGAATEAALGDP